jgi:hypothetical protein
MDAWTQLTTVKGAKRITEWLRRKVLKQFRLGVADDLSI